MKKLFSIIVCFIALSATTYADNEVPVEVKDLPAKAQKFLEQHFSKVEISYAKAEKELLSISSYEVIFVNGDKVEFTKKGDWKDVDCKFSQVPDGIVPTEIKNYITTKFPNNKIIKIDFDNHDYEVELNNNLEITFNKKYQVIEYDN